MKKYYNIIAIVTVAIFYFMLPINIVGANPDFAYPATVERDARLKLEKSLRNDLPAKALEYAMQIGVAGGLVSRDNAPQNALMFDSLANVLPKPYSCVALLLEAKVYSDIYLCNSYIYNNRTLPADSVPSNPTEWSLDIFSNKVTGIVSDAFSLLGDNGDIPVESLGDVVTNVKDITVPGWSVYDFMTDVSLDILMPFCHRDVSELLPFGNNKQKGSAISENVASTLRDSLVDNAITRDEGLDKVGPSAIFSERKCSYINGAELDKWLITCVEKFKNTPYCAPFLTQRYLGVENSFNDLQQDKMTDVKTAYDIINDYIKRYPNGYLVAQLVNLRERLSQKRINIRMADRFALGKDITGVAKVFNANETYLLVVKAGSGVPDAKVSLSSLVASGKKPIVAECIRIDGKTPFGEEREFSFKSLTSGNYAILTSSTPDLYGVYDRNVKNKYVTTFAVSGLSILQTVGSKESDDNRLYVVSSVNQRPVANARVRWYKVGTGSVKEWSKIVAEETTDSEGYVKGRTGNYNIEVSKNGDKFRTYYYSYSSRSSEGKDIRGDIFTDLSIYRPGQELNAAVVLYQQDGTKMHILPGKSGKILLFDANSQEISSCGFVTDEYGRAEGKFNIPESGLLGSYSLRIDMGGKNIGWHSVEVAEYKSPTFYVTVDTMQDNYQVGDTIRISGDVKTYSGMPLADSKIDFNVKFRGLPWRMPAKNASYGGSVTADSQGHYSISLPTEGLRNTEYSMGGYVLDISAASPSGETQKAPLTQFSLGKSDDIRIESDEIIEVGDSGLLIKAKVYDIFNHPVRKEIIYTLADESGEILAKGEFVSPSLQIKDAPASGEYKLSMCLKSDTSVSANATIVICRESDSRPPVKSIVWQPKDRIVCGDNNGHVEVAVGSSYEDSYIYVYAVSSSGSIFRKWIKVNDGIAKVAIPSPKPYERTRVYFCGLRDYATDEKYLTIIPQIQVDGIEIKAATFRDKITPGADESWKFSFKINDKSLTGIPVMAVMSNKALNALALFRWNFNPEGSIYYPASGSVNLFGQGSLYYSCDISKYISKSVKSVRFPAWNLYGYDFTGGGRTYIRGLKYRSTNSMATSGEMVEVYDSSAPMMSAKVMMKEVDAADEVSMEGAADYGGDSDETLRDIECPSAFFMPTLVTNEEGIADVNFKVPDFNGTWQLQIMGYTPKLKGNVALFETMASKPVMCSLSAPAFVYAGDRLTVVASLYNNSDESRILSGRIEIFNPLTGEILENQDFEGVKVDASGSRIMNMTFLVGLTNMLGVRAYAFSEDFKDGEQTVLPVYPAMAPVVESTNFYISSGEKSIEIKIPRMPSNGTMILKYNDNPVWECVTSLPTMADGEQRSSLSLADAYYAHATANSLVSRYPEIRKSILGFIENGNDSLLISRLDKDNTLKTVNMDNTPWVSDAESQTLRMSRLAQLVDSAANASRRGGLIDKLRRLQLSDGGWSWCEGMRSSEFITEQILYLFSLMNQMDPLDKELSGMVTAAVAYIDKSWMDRYNENMDKFDPLSMLNYLYIRSGLDVKPTPGIRKLTKLGVDSVAANWKTLEIPQKAMAAVLLYRNGKAGVASKIVESLTQYASYSKDKGMWFDNVNPGYNGMSRLAITSRVLRAISEISPDNPAIEGLRQWLMLEKQVEDWGDGSVAAEVISAVLSTGTDYIESSTIPDICIGDEKLDLSGCGTDGNYTLILTGDMLKYGKELRIVRYSESPAWGGIVTSSLLPLSKIKAASSGEIMVKKSIYKVADTPDGTVASRGELKVGDKVRVTITLVSDIDLQYVAVVDGRSACMSPDNQISSYLSDDGVWMYREVGKSATSLFIPFLSKGTHIFTYDCHIDRAGDYSGGITSARSLYYPLVTAHSAGLKIDVNGGSK